MRIVILTDKDKLLSHKGCTQIYIRLVIYENACFPTA